MNEAPVSHRCIWWLAASAPSPPYKDATFFAPTVRQPGLLPARGSLGFAPRLTTGLPLSRRRGARVQRVHFSFRASWRVSLICVIFLENFLGELPLSGVLRNPRQTPDSTIA